jgi:hypothetical protein
MIGGSSPGRTGNFSLHHRVQTGSEAHPASYPMGTRGSFAWGKAAFEADHSPSSSAGVKNAWGYTSTPSTRVYGMVLSYEKHRGLLFYFALGEIQI